MTGSPTDILYIVFHLFTVAYIGGLAVYDIRTHKIRNKAVIVFAAVVILFLPVLYLHAETTLPVFLVNTVFGVLVGGGVPLMMNMLQGVGLGGGDIKLMAVIGMYAGAFGSCLIMTTAAIVALLYYAARAIFKKKRTIIPYAPCLWFGALLYSIISL